MMIGRESTRRSWGSRELFCSGQLEVCRREVVVIGFGL